MCKLVGYEVIQVAEHPLTLDDSKATVTYVTEKLSNEAFDGAKVHVLNAKNILLADVEGKSVGYLLHMYIFSIKIAN